ncbi:Na+/H+ antiporter NhaA [Lentzea sp. NPDC034063]|uniref:Na+/H+ antiporter NhaA n=1 Tax=unclassified Lentzea TaxID=2643253 RepID=UPI0034041FB0
MLLTPERWLHPATAFFVVPLFAPANAGGDLGGGVLADAVVSRVAWAVAAGLVVGKILSIAVVTLLAHRTRIVSLPTGVSTRHVWGLAALAGIGFIVSLFIAELAYATRHRSTWPRSAPSSDPRSVRRWASRRCSNPPDIPRRREHERVPATAAPRRLPAAGRPRPDRRWARQRPRRP